MLLLIDKPIGITSFDVIRKLRKELDIRKMGHAGTLDPLASGLLIVATEADTKKLDQFLKLPKTYEVAIRIGEKRDTGDLEGNIIETSEVGDISKEDVEKVMEGFVKVHRLLVPIYSAIKVQGKPLYWYARNDVEVEVPEKDMEVTDIEFLSMGEENGFTTIHLSLAVTSGTYIRALAEEFGRQLGYPATTSALRRTTIGDYSVEDARALI
ncbi:tRNA pseudouridine(55) synthase TruB [Candidatus Wolfebacteria bacterium]|nr:tRNA pseudouridine(55) synthase TruB [Candidatus Wolfebacteria bacterium]